MSAIDDIVQNPQSLQTNVYELVVDLDNQWRKVIEAKNVIFTSFVSEFLDRPIHCNAVVLRRAISTFLANSSEHTDHGRVHLHVTGKSTLESDVVDLKVIVADTGAGIAPEKQKTLFSNPSIDSTTSLANIYELAQNLNGEVSVNSRSGKGSEFSFSIKGQILHPSNLLDQIESIMSKTPDAFTNSAMDDSIEQSGSDSTASDEMLHEILHDMTRFESVAQTPVTTQEESPAILELTVENELPIHAEGDRLQEEPIIDLEIISEMIETIAGDPEPEDQTFVNQEELLLSTGVIKVLLVEDEPSNQEVIKLLLDDKCYDILSAYNGHEALQALRTQSVDVILMDIRMPEMDGLQTIKAIRNSQTSYSRVPIIALTADSSAETNAECMAAGGDIFLSKPVLGNDLTEAIDFIINDRETAELELKSA